MSTFFLTVIKIQVIYTRLAYFLLVFAATMRIKDTNAMNI